MPAPKASVLKNYFDQKFSGKLSADAKDYLELLFKEVSSTWDTWQQGFKFGNVSVTGAAFPVWIGQGVGGSALAGPFAMKPVIFKKQTPAQTKMTNALSTVLKTKFAAYATSFKISAAQYSGASTATATSPGNFKATSLPAPLKVVASGTVVVGVSDGWKALLTKPEFDLSNPDCKVMDMVKAVSYAIEEAFKTDWLSSTTIAANTAEGPSTPGGAGNGVSLTNGLLS